MPAKRGKEKRAEKGGRDERGEEEEEGISRRVG